MTPISPIGPISSLVPFTGAANATANAAHTAARGSSAGAVAGAAGPTATGPTAPGVSPDAAASPDFSAALANGFDAVSQAQNHANQLAVQAATGQLVNPAQLTIATTKAQLMTQMATAIESKAVNAFNTIMSLRA